MAILLVFLSSYMIPHATDNPHCQITVCDQLGSTSGQDKAEKRS